MHPDLVHALQRYTRFAEVSVDDVSLALKAFEHLARDLALDDSGRSEALRAVLLRVSSAMGSIAQASSLRALAPAGGGESDAVAALESALGSLAQLAVGARARLDPEKGQGAPPAALRPLSVAVARALSGTEGALAEHVIAASLDAVLAGVPRGIARLVSAAVWCIPELPREGPAPDSRAPRGNDALPEWLPPRRTLGGFYVLRALSAGAVGSVFVAVRLEEKGEEGAERFALKVPEYSATAARRLSEGEFLKLFREEASALMALPLHRNLARFVTFDAGCRPKPILVMELVEGTTFENLLSVRDLDMKRALRVLDDVLQGLEAMHAAGVGHLDLKPSNVVLRGGEEAVLVDFGLSGKHIRPGCASGPYGAPEVWGALEGRGDLSPAKADVYSFACLAFEVLTQRPLFDADDLLGVIRQHFAHDGLPPGLSELRARPELRKLAEILSRAMRPNPAQRTRVRMLRTELSRVAPVLRDLAWPLVVASAPESGPFSIEDDDTISVRGSDLKVG